MKKITAFYIAVAAILIIVITGYVMRVPEDGSSKQTTGHHNEVQSANTTFVWVEPGQWYDIPIVQDEICRFRPVEENKVDWFMMVNNQSATIMTMSHTRTGKEGENRIDPVGVTNISVAIPGNGQRAMFQICRQRK